MLEIELSARLTLIINPQPKQSSLSFVYINSAKHQIPDYPLPSKLCSLGFPFKIYTYMEHHLNHLSEYKEFTKICHC